MELRVNDKCIGCSACVQDCPVSVLAMREGRPYIRPEKDVRCMNCQHCLTICPTGALTLNGVSAGDCIPISDLNLPTGAQLRELLTSRRSIRQFKPQELTQTQIAELLEALKCVPTGCNIRNLTFRVVATRARMNELRAKTVACLISKSDTLPEFLKNPVTAVSKNATLDPFFRHAPHLLIVQGDPKTGATPQVDCDAACAYFDLLAQASGYGTTWCGFLHIIVEAIPEVADIFGIPRGAPFYAMLFGLPAVKYARTCCRTDAARVEYL